MPFRILSIDGGGLRGIIPVLILRHIEYITGRKIIDCFDLFAGTSTGGLISAGLTVRGENPFSPKHTVEDLVNVYTKRGGEIFPVKNRLHKWYRSRPWSYLFRPQFKADGLQKVLEDLLTGTDGKPLKMSDCLKPVFIPAYDLVTNSPVFFKGRHVFNEKEENKDANLIDVCRATSAGPTYLPSYNFKFPHKYGRIKTSKVTAIDGGVFMNNPAMGALVEILKYREDEFYNFPDLKESDIFVLSIGTGHFSRDISGRSGNWGKLKWIKPSIDIMMWGNNQAVSYQAGEWLDSGKTNHLRLNVDILESRFADMANSGKETIDYLAERVYTDYMNNATLQEKLGRFLEEAGISGHN
jgi:uncharacterized protein